MVSIEHKRACLLNSSKCAWQNYSHLKELTIKKLSSCTQGCKLYICYFSEKYEIIKMLTIESGLSAKDKSPLEGKKGTCYAAASARKALKQK